MGVLALGACGEERRRTEEVRSPSGPAGEVYTVAEQQVEDLKPVLATVRSKRVVDARVRTPGTVASLKVIEGDHVEPGQVLGLVADPKIALRLKASDAQILALESRFANARAEFDRTSELQKRGVAPQARLDQAKTAFDVASNDLSAARSERAVTEKQAEEGQVLAPAQGRILRVPVTEGSVVLAGESIATIAANEYLLRLEVPERHARFMKKGDALKVGGRGLGSSGAATVSGRIVQIYPEIQGGRVIADAEVPDLGNYFVGERTLAWISAGTRRAIELPKDLVFKRHGLDYVRLAGSDGKASDIVVQLGQSEAEGDEQKTVQVLAGLKGGDRLVRP
ncbi:MAG: efflux RND transporter periplasmic adaptor subunit [Hyphomicrobiales bacterium]|nr:MAG: efflux RND transporter periplasmic adaptor subunit [Hyphomicrobiales bacterium]